MPNGGAGRTDTLQVAVDEDGVADMADLLWDDDDLLPGWTHTYASSQSCLDLDLVPAKGSFRSDFEVTGDVLGVGMCGAVVAAVDKGSGQKVAVKTFRRGELNVRQRVDLQHEIAHHRALDHPGVARLQAVYKSKRSVRLVMEHLGGGDLEHHLTESGPLSEAETIGVIRQVLQAVDHMHRHGLVHRDIKLENIVYESSDRDRVKLVDFGLCAVWEAPMAPMSRLCGTLSFLAPEVRDMCYTNKVDLWCVGTAAYLLLTGESLLRAPDWAPIFSPRFDDLSAEAKSFVAALLEVDPAARASAPEALRHRWMRETNDCSKDLHISATATTAATAATVDLGGVAALASEASEAEHSRRDEARGSGQQVQPVADSRAEGKTSLWRSLPSMPGVRSMMFSGRMMSSTWPAARRTKAASRVAPQELHPGAASSDAWYGLLPPTAT